MPKLARIAFCVWLAVDQYGRLKAFPQVVFSAIPSNGLSESESLCARRDPCQIGRFSLLNQGRHGPNRLAAQGPAIASEVLIGKCEVPESPDRGLCRRSGECGFAPMEVEQRRVVSHVGSAALELFGVRGFRSASEGWHKDGVPSLCHPSPPSRVLPRRWFQMREDRRREALSVRIGATKSCFGGKALRPPGAFPTGDPAAMAARRVRASQRISSCIRGPSQQSEASPQGRGLPCCEGCAPSAFNACRKPCAPTALWRARRGVLSPSPLRRCGRGRVVPVKLRRGRSPRFAPGSSSCAPRRR